MPKWKYSKVIGSVKYELGEKIMRQFAELMQTTTIKIKSQNYKKVCRKKKT